MTMQRSVLTLLLDMESMDRVVRKAGPPEPSFS